MVDFIGLGAQKAGTSWLYACLYEHPEICCPVKEIHYFSRDRYKKGKEWYESHFRNCEKGHKRGEFSTSYLYTPGTAKRIAECYPYAKLIAIVRNPIDRAYSQYRNAIKAGEISKNTTFSHYAADEPSVIEQGCYAKQLARYFDYDSRDELLVLVYEDIEKDPLAFIKQVYEHLEVDPEFVPKSLRSRVNTARTPKYVWLDRLMHKIAEGMRKTGLDKLVWFVKSSGATDALRGLNTEKRAPDTIDEATLADLKDYYRTDIHALSSIIQRDLLGEWGFDA